MTRGNVIEFRALVDVTLRLPNQPDIAIEFVVDTGFEGALTMPRHAIIALGLPYFERIPSRLADGTRRETEAYIATIMWEGREVEVAVLAMGHRALLGTALLEGKRLCIDFRDGGKVRIEDCPEEEL